MNRYQARNRKRIELPSGATITIAKLNVFNEPFITVQRGEDQETQGMKMSIFALTNPNNGPLCFEGEELRIVKSDVAKAGEITIGELDQEDADTIIREVVAFSGLTKGGAEDRKTFPEGSQTGGEPASAGGALPLSPNGVAQAAVG